MNFDIRISTVRFYTIRTSPRGSIKYILSVTLYGYADLLNMCVGRTGISNKSTIIFDFNNRNYACL